MSELANQMAKTNGLKEVRDAVKSGEITLGEISIRSAKLFQIRAGGRPEVGPGRLSGMPPWNPLKAVPNYVAALASIREERATGRSLREVA